MTKTNAAIRDRLAEVRSELADLEADAPKLAALVQSHTDKTEELRRNVRAGQADLGQLVEVQGMLAGASALLEDHRGDMVALRSQADALEAQAGAAADRERQADLDALLAASLDRRATLTAQLRQGIEDGLAALMANGRAHQELAQEAVGILGRQGILEAPHALVAWAGGNVAGELAEYLEVHHDRESDDWRGIVRDGLAGYVRRLGDRE